MIDRNRSPFEIRAALSPARKAARKAGSGIKMFDLQWGIGNSILWGGLNTIDWGF